MDCGKWTRRSTRLSKVDDVGRLTASAQFPNRMTTQAVLKERKTKRQLFDYVLSGFNVFSQSLT